MQIMQSTLEVGESLPFKAGFFSTPRELTETVVSGSFSEKPSRQFVRLHPLKESGTMRLQPHPRNHALPSRGPCRLPRNSDRVHSLGHAVAGPQSSSHRPSGCDAGTSSHKVPANNLAKLATSPSGSPDRH